MTHQTKQRRSSARCQHCGRKWSYHQALANHHGCKNDNGGSKTRCPKCGWCSVCDNNRESLEG